MEEVNYGFCAKSRNTPVLRFIAMFIVLDNYNMDNRTDRDQLHDIKLRIEQFLIQPRSKQPSFLTHYNQTHSQAYRYRKRKVQNDNGKSSSNLTPKARPIPKSTKSTSVSPKACHSALKNEQIKIISDLKKSSRTPLKDRSLSKSKNKGVDKKDKINKKEPLKDSSLATRLEKVRKRYTELVTLALRGEETRPLHPKGNQRTKIKDISQVKHQLQKELAKYCHAVKTKKMTTKQRSTILDYIEQIMNKYEFLLTD